MEMGEVSRSYRRRMSRECFVQSDRTYRCFFRRDTMTRRDSWRNRVTLIDVRIYDMSVRQVNSFLLPMKWRTRNVDRKEEVALNMLELQFIIIPLYRGKKRNGERLREKAEERDWENEMLYEFTIYLSFSYYDLSRWSVNVEMLTYYLLIIQLESYILHLNALTYRQDIIERIILLSDYTVYYIPRIESITSFTISLSILI